MTDPSRPASGVRVIVSRSAPDSTLADDLRSERQRRLRLANVPLVVCGIFFVVQTVRLVLAIRDGRGPSTATVVFALVLVGVLGVFVRRRHHRLARRVPEHLWHSGDAVYLGPLDDVDGFPLSAAFARRNRIGGVLGVTLVVGARGIDAVPVKPGRHEPLLTAFADLCEVQAHFGTRKERAIVLVRHDGRRATFKARPDDRLVRTLESLGAEVPAAT